MFNYAVILLLVSLVNATPRIPSGRIIGGESTTIETYPYQVSIQQFGMHICGGSIIAKKYVLTAGHCVDSTFLMKIRAGTTTKSFGGTSHAFEKVIRHENFSISEKGIPVNDIALIKVKQPFPYGDTRQPIELFNNGEKVNPGVNATITGWGSTGGAWGTAITLQTVNIPILEQSVCNNAYEEVGGLPEGQICAAYYGVGGKDACQGDSGGPLAIDGRLAGIVSWGNGCAQPEYPGVYTEIAYYRDWINKHIES